ncbi:MAG: TonB-dependent receptor [Acidobacteriota bacterium]|nr:TonB-dependent receptor [Acidobacteriota bacterium]
MRILVRGSFRAVAALFLVPFLVTALPAPAQTVAGTLQGTVMDPGGGPLPGASVVVRAIDTGFERRLVTNDRGFYIAPLLQIGAYRVTASLLGFGSVTRGHVEVSLNATAIANFTLSQKATAEVRVVAEAPQINTVNAEVKGSLTAQQIQDKPVLAQGSFLALAESFTGFQENPTSGQNNPTLSSGSSINFNGTGTRGATFQINGVNNDDSSENQNRQGASLATIQEFQVLTNTYSAEFGRGYGAVVLVQTKSGTNDVKGEAYSYFQNNRFNEKTYFAQSQPKPVNHRTEYGAVLGIPILRDTLFAFVSFDQTDRAGQQDYARDLFTPAELALPRLTRGNNTAANQAWIDGILSRYPSGAVPNDPRSIRTYATQQNFDQPDKDYSARLDFEPAQADHLTARYQYSRQLRDSDDVILGEAAFQNNKQVNLGATWTHVFSNSFSGELRYGLGLRSTRVDIKAGNDTPIVRFAGSPVSGTILGNAGSFPIHRDQRDNQFVYNVYGLLGTRHALKAGLDIRLQQLDDLADNFSRGFWTFRAACGGTTYASAYAAFVDGCVSTFQKGYGNFFLENRMNEYNFYAEDQWQALDTLSLSLGARFEYVKTPYEKEDRVVYGFKDNKYIEPRVGLAWTPTAKSGFLGALTGGPGNAVLRGGFGIYHGRIFQSVFSQSGANIRFNPPNAALLAFTDQVNVSDPTNGFVFTPGPQTTRVSITQVDPDLKMPQAKQWNVSFERKIPWDSTIRLSYVGSHGSNLLKFTPTNLAVTPAQGGIIVVDHPFNAPRPGFPDLRGVMINKVAADWKCAGTGYIPGIAVNATCPVPVPIANNEISLRVPRTNERRPNPLYGQNLLVSNDNISNYNAFQMEIQKRFSGGFAGQLSYTYGKALDTGSDATTLGAGDTNITGPSESFAYGYSRFDTRHRLTLLASYDLPFGSGRRDLVGQLIGGWKISGTFRFATGTPFSVSDSGTGDVDWDGFAENRPVIVDGTVLGNTVDTVDTAQQQLPAGAFRRATPVDSVDMLVSRNAFRSDMLLNLDLGLYKSVFLPWAGHVLMLRAEVYNVFNRTQFGIPSSDLAASNFGQITGTSINYTPRTFQFAARYVF